jgi:hypothetical protein
MFWAIPGLVLLLVKLQLQLANFAPIILKYTKQHFAVRFYRTCVDDYRLPKLSKKTA